MFGGGPADNIPVDALNGANAPIRSGRPSKARTEANTSSARHPYRSQSHSESDLGSAFDPTRTVARAGTEIQHRDRIRPAARPGAAEPDPQVSRSKFAVSSPAPRIVSI